MMKIKKLVLSILAVLLTADVRAEIKVSDVEVFSGYPWTEVVVGYTITGTDVNADAIRLKATDKTANQSYTTYVYSGDKWSEGHHVLRWNAASEGVKFSSANVVFAVSVMNLGGVQLWENGPYWAECNVGAANPEALGYSFWWGDTVGYKHNGSRWNAVDGSRTGFSFDRENCPTYDMDDATLRSQGYTDATGNLVGKYDAATQHLGAPWRMPSDAEFELLRSNCTTTWTTRNGVRGLLVTGRGGYESKNIFLPAAGYGDGTYLQDSRLFGFYWSSSPDSDDSRCAWRRYIKDGFNRNTGFRFLGYSVRPVRGFAQ